MSRYFRDSLNEQLKDEEFRKEYESLEAEFQIIREIIAARKDKNITQKELSDLTGITQADISKIENPAGMTLVAIIYLTLFSTAIPTVLQTFCQKYTTSTRASILMSTESLFAPLFAFFILSERLSFRVAAGAGLVLFAVFVSETKLGLKKTPQ